mmetsp:Transcript_94274/g.239907  ORF Transcript_94274/g.239907 Transcript_94274/m.239907 type:complete len:235 (+) Transcript_94274:672-1376(+)
MAAGRCAHSRCPADERRARLCLRPRHGHSVRLQVAVRREAPGAGPRADAGGLWAEACRASPGETLCLRPMRALAGGADFPGFRAQPSVDLGTDLLVRPSGRQRGRQQGRGDCHAARRLSPLRLEPAGPEHHHGLRHQQGQRAADEGPGGPGSGLPPGHDSRTRGQVVVGRRPIEDTARVLQRAAGRKVGGNRSQPHDWASSVPRSAGNDAVMRCWVDASVRFRECTRPTTCSKV